MAQPKEKELGSRNMRTSTKIIIGIFAVVMALSMMLPSLSAIFASSPATEESTESTQDSTKADEESKDSKDEAKKEEESKDKDKDKDKAEDDADPKVPDNESLKSLEETNSEKVTKYKERLKKDSNDLVALLNLGDLYMNWGYSASSSSSTDEEREYSKKLLKKAMSYYDRYLKLNDSVTIKINRALSQYYAGDNEAAIKALEKVCKDYPESALAQAQLGYLYESQYDTEKATAAYKKAIELDPEDTSGIKSYASQRIIAMNSKVDSIGDPGDAAITPSDNEGQSELISKLTQNSDAAI